MQTYIHKVHYYETDRMGITHHSNYIRWMEEARVSFLNQAGYGYKRMEDEGVISPVLAVDCKYKQTTTFDDEISIDVRVKDFNGVRLVLEYTMKKVPDASIVLIGTTEHCFLDEKSHPVRMKKEFPELYGLLMDLLAAE